jgi:hypothetical protein
VKDLNMRISPPIVKLFVGRIDPAMKSPLRPHLRHRTFRFHPVNAGIRSLCRTEPQKNFLVKKKFGD